MKHLPFVARSIGFPSNGVADQGWKLYITSLIMVLSAGLFVIARIATRLASKRLGWDDYTIVASIVRLLSITGPALTDQWLDLLDMALGYDSAGSSPWLRQAHR